MYRASVDIGTNSTRLLIASVHSTGQLHPKVMQERLTRLGEGLDSRGCLSVAAMDRVIDALYEYRQLIKEYPVVEPVVFATSATREAPNRHEFLERIVRECGFSVRVLSGDEEAFFSFQGVFTDLSSSSRDVVCDIGGGSTEIIYGQHGVMSRRKSLMLGSRRLTTSFIHSTSPCPDDLSRMRVHIQRILANEHDPESVERCIGVGGTATTLALMDKDLSLDKANQAHHHSLTRGAVATLVTRLSGSTLEQRRQMKGLHPKRADVIVAGAVLLEELLNLYKTPVMVISIRDLLFGILISSPVDDS
jgi:exopolyphosphatase/guanosine-5'-triphosphate,3'-diphosphate pyrophosphatase